MPSAPHKMYEGRQGSQSLVEESDRWIVQRTAEGYPTSIYIQIHAHGSWGKGCEGEKAVVLVERQESSGRRTRTR
eukprot:7200075-Prymnesium_polylepis.1